MHRLRFIGIAFCLAAAFCVVPVSSAMGQIRTLKAVQYAGKRYVALDDLARMYGLPLEATGKKTLAIRGQYISLQFTTNARQADLNGCAVWLHAPVIKVRGRWSVSDADAMYLIDPLVRPSAYLGSRQSRTVVLDPGHGGKDPGAISRNGAQEKALVLDIAKRVRAHLAAAGVRVVMTRDQDRFWTLEDRPYIASRAGGDVFVSIHINTAASRTANGIETFVTPVEDYPPTSESRLNKAYPRKINNRFNHSNSVLGSQIQRSVVGITRATDRGLKHARFAVLRDTSMPAALVECGFFSNPAEEKRLNTPSYRETLAQGIAQGILNYLAIVNRARIEMGAPLIQQPTRMASAASTVAPATPAPISMAARSWGHTETSSPAVAAPQAATAPVTDVANASVVQPVQPVAAPPPVAAQPTPVAVQSVSQPSVAERPRKAIAPPPSMLLNTSLTPSGEP